MNRFRKELLEIFDEAKRVIRCETEASHKSIPLLAELAMRGAAVELGIAKSDFIAQLGLSEDQYYKRLQAWRVTRHYPEFQTMLEKKETTIAALALVSAKITDANSRTIGAALPGMSKRDVELFLSRVTPAGTLTDREETIDLKVRVTRSELQEIERAVEILSASGKVPSKKEVLMKAVALMVEARDPVRMAERAKMRSEKVAQKIQNPAPGQTISEVEPVQEHLDDAPVGHAVREPIPAAVKHAVMLRDQGQCTEIMADGRHCPERGMVEFDHKILVCRGGKNTVDNIYLKCKSHNLAAAGRELGAAFMEKWRLDRRYLGPPGGNPIFLDCTRAGMASADS